LTSVAGVSLIKRFLPRTLFGRSLLIIIAPLVLLQVVSAFVFYDRHWHHIMRRLTHAVAGDIAATIEGLRRAQNDDDRAAVIGAAYRHMDVRVEIRPGAILPNVGTNSAPGYTASLLSQALEERVRRPFRIDTESRPDEVEIDVQLPEAVLIATVSRSRLSSPTTYIFVLWMVGTSLVLFAVASIFMRNQVRPIRRLAAAASSFGKGRDVPDFKPAGATEVRRAAEAFNLMRQRIQRQISQRTEMLAGVSHDLRTPLTRMKLQIAMLGESPEVENLRADVAEMETMVAGYLDFVRGEGTEKMDVADLAAILDDVAAAARRQNATIDLHCGGPLVLPLRPNAIRRSFANLVGNASRYGEHVWVRAGVKGDAVEVLIDDDGPGIPMDRREDVFKPFHRVEGSRNPSTGGVGLGLTIARDIVRSHGGDVTLEDAPTGGLRVRVRLPL